MDMPMNRLKENLTAGTAQIGTFIGFSDAVCAELMATTGFDFLLFDAEHGTNTVRTVLAQLQAVAPYPVHAVVRPVGHDPAQIKQYLDIGAQTLLIPMVETPQQAAALVAATRYPPAGIRGVGTAMARAARWNGVPDYFRHADDQICLMVQIESRRGLEHLDTIAHTDGVDGVFIGPADLAASLGYLGQPGHPEVKKTVEQALRRIAAAGKIAGVYTADAALATQYRACGARFLVVGVDTLILRQAAMKLAASFRETPPTAQREITY